jgi:hypothetical protein
MVLLFASAAYHAVVVRGREGGDNSTQRGRPASPDGSVTIYLPLVKHTPSELLTSDTPEYGLNFISSAEAVVDETQYQNGLAAGAGWNRWPLYWYRVEKSDGNFDWGDHDHLVAQDIAHGLEINAILMGTPGFYQTAVSGLAASQMPVRYKGFAMSATTGSAPEALYAPVFSDGSDLPGPGKQINGNNKWARFVFEAVTRYKPGGLLSQQLSWPQGTGITHWEMWNEPDLLFFWNGTAEQYARLLKVGYLAAKHADEEAQVLFGGLANNLYNCSQPDPSAPHFLDRVLDFLDADPQSAASAYYHDIFATHSYSRSWDSFCLVFRATRSLRRHGLAKPIWLNETGVPAWDDYPGPVWDPASAFRSTLSEQADYTIQTAFYAAWAGADNIFHFQLYDGCGNQPAGTDFPPHNGELCDGNGNLKNHPQVPCAGDAFGFYRNPPDAACFSQHPHAESARPKLAAFQTLAAYLKNVVPLDRQRPGGPSGPQEWISFYRPETGQRIMGLWARFGDPQTAQVPAVNPAGTALLVASDGAAQMITAHDGVYTIHLPGATNQNTPWDLSTGYPIGGKTFILIEPMTN